jgi:hypothetical protein
MDRFHSRCEPTARSGPQWTMSGAENGRDNASPTRGPRALEVIGGR